MNIVEQKLLLLGQKLPIIGSGAIGTADPPSAGNLGALWVDGAVMYQSSIVGNLAGNDNIDFPVPVSENGINSDAEMAFLFKTDGAPIADSDVFANRSVGGTTTNIRIVLQPDGKLQVRIRNSVGGTVANVTSLSTVNDSIYRKISYKIVSGVLSFYINNVLQGTGNTGSDMQVAISSRLIGQAPSGTRTYNRFCCYQINRANPFLLAQVNDGSGVTVVDSVGGNNGTITDGSPLGVWVYDWKPINL